MPCTTSAAVFREQLHIARVLPAFSNLPEKKILDHSWLEGSRLVVIQESHIHIISAEELQVVRTIEKLGTLFKDDIGDDQLWLLNCLNTLDVF